MYNCKFIYMIMNTICLVFRFSITGIKNTVTHSISEATGKLNLSIRHRSKVIIEMTEICNFYILWYFWTLKKFVRSLMILGRDIYSIGAKTNGVYITFIVSLCTDENHKLIGTNRYIHVWMFQFDMYSLLFHVAVSFSLKHLCYLIKYYMQHIF